MAAPDTLIQDLLVAIGAGDRRAFRRLYEATSPHLLAILISKLGRREIAEELLQDCYIKVWQKAGSYRPERGQAMAWLTTLVRNRAVDWMRARRPDETAVELADDLDLQADDGADPSRIAEIADTMSRVVQSLSSLSPQMRASVLLTHHSGYTHEESARLMRAPLGSVKSWVRRGLEQLRNDPVIQM